MIKAFGLLSVRLLVTILVLVYLASGIESGEVVRAVTRIEQPMWLLLVTVVVVDRLLAAGRWLLLVRASGVELPTWFGARLFLVSSFLGSLLPAGVGGDVARAWELANRTGHSGQALAVTVADRWLGLAAVLAIGVVGTTLTIEVHVDPRLVATLHVLFAGVLLAGLGGLLGDRLAAALLPVGRVQRVVSRPVRVIRQFPRHGSAISLVIGLSFATQTLRIMLAWLIGVGLAMEVPLAYYFVIMPIGIVSILLPISIGGFGPAQGLIIWMLRPAGVPDELSFAMSTLYLCLGLVANLPGAVLFLHSRRRVR